ncbi:hypothetical protein C817_01300 [Dorea sp. 5-2]|nr:hypothetical protein C817_01300 [Dorea sp. 5-2]
MGDIAIKNISFSYEEGGKVILKDIDTRIHAGEFVCVLGQSGCGKSTLLRLIAGLESPTAGELSIDGAKVDGASLQRGVVFQDYGLFPWMTAGENIILALKQRFPERSKQELKKIAVDMLKRVGLEDSVFGKLPKELSGGMKQRCAIAQAFSIDPPVLLMDEPFGALDAVTRTRLQDLVLELWAQGEPKKTVLFVTHDVDEAMLLANRLLVLGQSPSNIIYDCVIPDEKRPTRESQFEDPEFLKMRTELIRQINKDVASHVEKTM